MKLEQFLTLAYTYDLDSTHISGLPTNSGGGLFELSTSGSGSNINSIEAKYVDATKYEHHGQNNTDYPFIEDRKIGRKCICLCIYT